MPLRGGVSFDPAVLASWAVDCAGDESCNDERPGKRDERQQRTSPHCPRGGPFRGPPHEVRAPTAHPPAATTTNIAASIHSSWQAGTASAPACGHHHRAPLLAQVQKARHHATGKPATATVAHSLRSRPPSQTCASAMSRLAAAGPLRRQTESRRPARGGARPGAREGVGRGGGREQGEGRGEGPGGGGGSRVGGGARGARPGSFGTLEGLEGRGGRGSAGAPEKAGCGGGI